VDYPAAGALDENQRGQAPFLTPRLLSSSDNSALKVFQARIKTQGRESLGQEGGLAPAASPAAKVSQDRDVRKALRASFFFSPT
jgi:hypothetical protein